MKKLIIYFIFLLAAGGCKEKYLPSITSPPAGYLVVEGFINSGQSPTTITLSRTTKLYDSVKIVYELNASVYIESENQETYPLFESGNGVYISDFLQLNSNGKYRLRIRTTDSKEYASEFVPFKHTPAIDTLSWQRENGGVKIYVNTHDDLNNTRYYQWKYEETWEIRSRYKSSLEYFYDADGNLAGVGYRTPYGQEDTTIYKCWPNNNSRNIIIGSSEKLSENKIYLPVASVEAASEKISVLYSINVRQYALSRDAYMFLSKIKKNTEQLGSIFDAQPSELKGNIHCLTDPAEIVVGFVDMSEEKEKRVFINNDQLPGWNYALDCPVIVIGNDLSSISAYGQSLMPTTVHSVDPFGNIKDFNASYPFCVDCTTRGPNIKPDFWP